MKLTETFSFIKHSDDETQPLQGLVNLAWNGFQAKGDKK